ncbi:MAG: hypothetical protein BWY06_00726 [Candidatus Latescibacteria bacterium ADurb.Bin168]|nr:MAG: hypothetical protein BWY06_00726 [Candidatus Latescibacteria bacterium ADurb.Bin168]
MRLSASRESSFSPYISRSTHFVTRAYDVCCVRFQISSNNFHRSSSGFEASMAAARTGSVPADWRSEFTYPTTSAASGSLYVGPLTGPFVCSWQSITGMEAMSARSVSYVAFICVLLPDE